MEILTDPLAEPFMRQALLAILLVALSAGLMGTWMILYGYSYAGESIAHSAFPGAALAALIGAPLLIGGIPAVALAALLIAGLAARRQVERDTAVAAVVIAFFGIGGLLALAPTIQGNVDRLLFGDVLATSSTDLVIAGVTAVLITSTHLALRSRFLAGGFDPAHARTMKLGTGRLEATLSVLLAIAVLIGIQALGNLLVIALLVAPAATALLITKRHTRVFIIATAVAAGSGILGLYLSYHVGGAAGASIAAIALAAYIVTALVKAAVAKSTRSTSRSATGRHLDRAGSAA